MFKNVLKSLFSSAGYEIRNKRYKDIFTIRQTMTEAFDHLKSIGFDPGLIIDIGAADGTPPLQDSFPDSSFFWVEPLQEFQPKLEALRKKLKGEYLIAAVGKLPIVPPAVDWHSLAELLRGFHAYHAASELAGDRHSYERSRRRVSSSPPRSRRSREGILPRARAAIVASS